VTIVSWGLQPSQRMGKKVTYQEAGVDTRAAAALVNEIKADVSRTQKQRKLHNSFGLFAAAFDLSEYQNPVIVTGCDGVGTKLELLLEHGMEAEAGKDLVAMSVNDIITTGGDPLMFLDYIGIEKLQPERIKRLISGMCDYLEDCGCILAGGETAEMPGLVPPEVVELSGFCIGAVEKEDLIQPETIREGDVLVGYASDGFHANGWSLCRRILAEHGSEFNEAEIKSMLAPTRLYDDVTSGFKKGGLRARAFAHITGGGLPENLERLLRGMGADLTIPYWENEPVQKLLAHSDPEDRFNAFNMGIGWVAIVDPSDADTACSTGPGGVVLGEIRSGEGVNVAVQS
jgi:phosphoribosylformylglycinamidine cyclo-ligase